MKPASIRSLLFFTVISGTFLNAQVDPRLAKCQTDVLDVYFGSSANGGKPEIISVIDNSASMSALYWSKYYYADNSEAGTWHYNPWISSSDDSPYIVPLVYKSGTGATLSITVSLHQSKSWDGVDLDTHRAQLVQGGLLIKPDGNPVTLADVGNSEDPSLWIQRASHVRFAFTSQASATYYFNSTPYSVPNVSIKPRPLTVSGSTADYTSASKSDIQRADKIRVVDIPLPWGAFDAVPYYEGENTGGIGPDGSALPAIYRRPLSPEPTWPTGDYTLAKTNKHPQHAYVYDPGPTGTTAQWTWYEVDALWSQNTNQMYKNGSLGGKYSGLLQNANDIFWLETPAPSNVYGRIGLFNYSPDYLWWCFFGQDIRSQQGGVNPNGKYNNNMVDDYTGDHEGKYTIADVRENGAGFALHNGIPGNGLPCLTKFMAIKKALFQVYVENQNDVNWAIRFLNGDPSGTANSCYDSDNKNGNPGDRKLLLLQPSTASNHPDANSAQYIITMQCLLSTPLSAAMMNAYAQMANSKTGTAGSVFNGLSTACSQSFLIMLSDGAPKDTGSNPADPYQEGASKGNSTLVSGYSSLKGKSYYNIATLSGVAAHHPAITSVSWDAFGGSTNKVYLPWSVTSRGASTTSPRYTSTLTIGVGLTGTILDSLGPKRAMYSAALYGWEKRTKWNIKAGASGYSAPDPYLSTSSATSKQENPFFFDASDPDGLTSALNTAIGLTRIVTNTMGAPVAPLVGLSLGKQIYVGLFNTPDSPVWTGDLLMTGLKVSGNSVAILKNDGVTVTTQVDHSSAVWSASDSVFGKTWKNRKLFTLKPSPSNLPTGPSHPGAFTSSLLDWNESLSASDMPNDVLGVTTDTERRSLIRFMMGAGAVAQAEASTNASSGVNRSDIMGDIINSTPAILEFPMDMVPSGSSLASFDTSDAYTSKRFRLIMVGDNQGILHGFGEVSGYDSAGHVQGAVDELWGFIIPDDLIGLQSWRNGVKHMYMMDGSPIVYLKEQGTSNGVADGSDIVRVAFGLGKAGRSYYCLKFTNNHPDSPEIAWMIRPDEYGSATSGDDLVIKTMGFSTCKPAPSRIVKNGVVKDVFFIGGGLSTTDVDTAFSASKTATPPGYGSGTNLGRSIIAVNVDDGTVEKTWSPGLGCIPAAVVPVEVMTNTYRTQRVYFTDTSGGVSVLGAKATSGNMRTDTSEVTNWDVRKIFTAGYLGTVISTSPAVFILPSGYPVVRTTDPKPIVNTIGIVTQTGDRNDPMDNDEVNPNNGTSPAKNKLIMVLDRQDSAKITGKLGAVDTYGFTDYSKNGSDLADLTAITSSADSNISPSYTYLKTYFGYQLTYNAGVAKSSGTGKFYQKGVASPLVLNSALFFSNYTPSTTATVCGGSGTTYTYRLCDVLNPVFSSGSVQAIGTSTCDSGWFGKYNDIPSELAGIGIRAVLQAGEVQDENNQGQGKIQTLGIPGNATTNLLRLRAWRIIR
jgi:hypothetical protein